MSHPSHNAGDDYGHYHEEFTPQSSAWAGAALTVGATYVVFLIFAQFGFLKLVQEVVGGQSPMLKAILGVMAVAGLAASAWAGWTFAENRSLHRLVGSFAICGAAAGLSLLARSPLLLFAVSVLIGLGLGGLTVTLAATLRRVTGGDRLGSAIGLGTGTAYAICNLPFVFNGGRETQGFVALAAACVGLLGVQMLDLRAPRQVPNSFDYQRPGITAWVMVLMALVWLDSGAFNIIQQSPYLKEMTWGSGRLYANAAIHFAAALLAGYMMDKRWVGRAVLLATAMLAAACLLIEPNRAKLTEGVLLYTAAVSIYSTALVFYPSRSSRPQCAAIVYGVAGWIGSGLGISMVEGLSAIPHWLVGTAAAVAAVGLVFRGWMLRRETRRFAAGVLLLTLATGLAEWSSAAGSPGNSNWSSEVVSPSV